MEERDWRRQPYTYEEWKNLELFNLQKAGIWPFFKKKRSEIADGDSVTKHLNIDYLYGNIVDGIPNVDRTGDGELQFKKPETLTYDLDDVRANTSSISSTSGSMAVLKEVEMGGYYSQGLKIVSSSTPVIQEKTHILDAGSIANSDVMIAVAGNYLNLIWVIVGWNADPAVEYVLGFHEEDQGDIRTLRLAPAQNYEDKKWFYMETSVAANKAIQVSISGGAGVEEITTLALGVPFT